MALERTFVYCRNSHCLNNVDGSCLQFQITIGQNSMCKNLKYPEYPPDENKEEEK